MAQWQSIIKECKESGMTVAEFCEDRNISWHAYYYWLRKIREYITQPKTTETEFVQFALSLQRQEKLSQIMGLNLAERSIRPFTIGRKNWVFSGSPAGAEASAAAYSLIETCIVNKVDTKEYQEYIFTNMFQEESLKDDAVLEKYLPWNVSLPTE